MRYLTRRLTPFFIMIFLLAATPSATLAIDDAIIAVVNDELITLKDLRDYIRSTYISLVAQGIEDTQLKSIMKDLEINGINKLIEDKLILSRANKRGLNIRKESIDERIGEVKKKYLSDQAFTDALIKNGATISDLEEKFRDEMKIKYIVDYEVRSKIFINPQEVTKFYEENRAEFNRGARINLDSIFIPFDKKNKEEAQKKAAEAIHRIKDEEDFKEVAKDFSKTPSVGIIEQGQLLPSIEDIVFNLSINEVSEPLEVDNGIFIFKLLGKISPETSSLTDVKTQISDHLFKTKFHDRLMNWLKDLREDAYIEIKE